MPLGALLIVVGSFLFAACAGESPEVTVDDPELVQGREVYVRSCASCHGSSGGGGLGPKLSEGAVTDSFPTIADQIELIANGRGTMPSYTGRLSPEEMQAVARYTREVLG
jgi:mono/diheme cytochrome c family protein